MFEGTNKMSLKYRMPNIEKWLKRENNAIPFHVIKLGEFYNTLIDYQTIDNKFRFTGKVRRIVINIADCMSSAKKYIYAIFMKEHTFISLILFLTAYFVFRRLSDSRYLHINIYYEIFWLLCFCYLMLNVAYMLINSIYARLSKTRILRESNDLEEIPSVAIIYTIRSESTGLYERMEFTLSNNNLIGTDLWILSGDTTAKYIEYENSVVDRLCNKFGESKIRYMHSTNPGIKKREFLEIWLATYSDKYKYFIVCDADSSLPEECILKLIKKAEHPSNKDVAVFQSSLNVVNARTFYSKRQAIGVMSTMTLYTNVQQNLFKRILYFGHNALIRVEDFKRTHVPQGMLSHDVWETVSLAKIGKKVAFCPDVISYEESPTNYIEDIKRIRRWCKGNLETWKLIFSKDISLGLRFMVGYGVYSYTTQFVLFIWFISGMSMARNQIWQGLAGLSGQQYSLFVITMIIVFFHKLIAYRGFSHVKDTFRDIVFSTVMGLNNIFYVSMGVILIPFQKFIWKPMKKNPNSSMTLKAALKFMWPSTLIGIYGIYNGYNHAPYWLILAFPILFSFGVGIMVAYVTSIPMEEDKIPLNIFKKGNRCEGKR